MSYSLGIRIMGEKIEDDAAKIICLRMRGIGYEEIEWVTYIKVKVSYNHITKLYALLNIPRDIVRLLYLAEHSGFDFLFKYQERDLLSAEELARLAAKVPRLAAEDTELILTKRKKK
jgi:hypothetical protein